MQENGYQPFDRTPIPVANAWLLREPQILMAEAAKGLIADRLAVQPGLEPKLVQLAATIRINELALTEFNQTASDARTNGLEKQTELIVIVTKAEESRAALLTEARALDDEIAVKESELGIKLNHAGHSLPRDKENPVRNLTGAEIKRGIDDVIVFRKTGYTKTEIENELALPAPPATSDRTPPKAESETPAAETDGASNTPEADPVGGKKRLAFTRRSLLSLLTFSGKSGSDRVMIFLNIVFGAILGVSFGIIFSQIETNPIPVDMTLLVFCALGIVICKALGLLAHSIGDTWGTVGFDKKTAPYALYKLSIAHKIGLASLLLTLLLLQVSVDFLAMLKFAADLSKSIINNGGTPPTIPTIVLAIVACVFSCPYTVCEFDHARKAARVRSEIAREQYAAEQEIIQQEKDENIEREAILAQEAQDAAALEAKRAAREMEIRQLLQTGELAIKTEMEENIRLVEALGMTPEIDKLIVKRAAILATVAKIEAEIAFLKGKIELLGVPPLLQKDKEALIARKKSINDREKEAHDTLGLPMPDEDDFYFGKV